ncbi:MAG: GGDEF domain-containing protein, partial [Roseburia sp.]|nr:GGDEF domain-containing protein [Roseburia sp.]
REQIECYIALAFFHRKLGDYQGALEYQENALPLIKVLKQSEPEVATNIETICLAYQGLICAKQGKFAEAEEILRNTEHLTGKTAEDACLIPVLELNLQVALVKEDKTRFEQCFKRLLEMPILEEGFFETLEYYFDICTFLFEKGMQKEVRALLNYIKSYYDMIPLAYLKYDMHNLELIYAKNYGDEEAQWQATQNLLAVIQEYEAEQQRAKLYSFDYIEFMHQERDLSAKMEQKSKLDPMTGLFNKFTIEFLVDEYFSQMDEKSAAALLIIDMDHFKQINDTLGHLAGDAILTDTAAVIRRFFKGDALCGRVGGDEFMVFVKDVEDVSSLLLQAEFLRQEIAKTTSERNITIAIQASVGVAVSTAGFRDYASMFTAADEALYRAKKEGRNRISVIE